MSLHKHLVSILLFLGIGNAFAGEGDAWNWPAYSPTVYYNFKDQGFVYEMPTKNYEGNCYNSAAGHKDKDWWTFVWGANRNSLVSDEAIENMLTRFNKDFSYITDTLGWPRDRRVQEGYRSSIYLYGSMDCTGSNDNQEKGGWQTVIDGYPCVSASYYPVYSFDSNCPYDDRQSQMDAMIHEGIHSILTDLGAKHVHWFQEGGNTWLQQEMMVRQSKDEKYSGMGFLNAVDLIAPFIPIECYSGWLLDGSFGGPGAQGVDAGVDSNNQTICNWRTTLGGVQYGNLFPTFLGLWISEGAVPWIWVNTTNSNKYILETMAGKMGDEQPRRLIMEYRAKLAMCDMKKWSEEMRNLLNQNVGGSISHQFTPCVKEVDAWKVTPYVVTTNNNGVLTPENRTTPGWSGANVIPLTVSGNTVKVELQPIGDNMSLQICYRATDGNPVYSNPVMGNDTAVLNIEKTPQDGVVFAVVCNTDYAYIGEETRKKHHDFRLKLIEGISKVADPYTKWYNNFKLDYDWEAVSHTATSENQEVTKIETTGTFAYDVKLPISTNYKPVQIVVNADNIAEKLGISTSVLTSDFGENILLYGVNSNGSLYKTSTANDPGHWFNANGNVVSYGTSSTIYSELDVNSMTFSIGNYPNLVKVGDVYSISQAFVSGNKQVTVTFNITIADESEGTSMNDEISSDEEPLVIFYEGNTIVANYNVLFDSKVKLSLYTAYGALLTHLVNEWMPTGSYQYGIDLESMGLQKGIYLIKYETPGVSKTKAVIMNVR